jgi:hypothetical protein
MKLPKELTLLFLHFLPFLFSSILSGGNLNALLATIVTRKEGRKRREQPEERKKCKKMQMWRARKSKRRKGRREERERERERERENRIIVNSSRVKVANWKKERRNLSESNQKTLGGKDRRNLFFKCCSKMGIQISKMWANQGLTTTNSIRHAASVVASIIFH